VLLHELAHVHRRDLAASVAQRAVELVLWFHPATWLISGAVRRERELCCDDAVIATGGSAAAMARALVALVDRRGQRGMTLPSLGAASSPLVERVYRLVAAARAERHAPTAARESRRTWRREVAHLAVALACVMVLSGATSVAGHEMAHSDAVARAFVVTRWAPPVVRNFRGTDPAGSFVLRVLRGRVMAASLGGTPVASSQVEQRGDTIRILGEHGSTALAVALDPRGAISWAPRRMGTNGGR
jgi:hypothetical protein